MARAQPGWVSPPSSQVINSTNWPTHCPADLPRREINIVDLCRVSMLPAQMDLSRTMRAPTAFSGGRIPESLRSTPHGEDRTVRVCGFPAPRHTPPGELSGGAFARRYPAEDTQPAGPHHTKDRHCPCSRRLALARFEYSRSFERRGDADAHRPQLAYQVLHKPTPTRHCSPQAQARSKDSPALHAPEPSGHRPDCAADYAATPASLRLTLPG